MNIHGAHVLKDQDVSALTKKILSNGELQILPASEYRQFSQEQISLFCVKNALYGLPTTELIDWLKEKIGNRKAIEIGAGNGSLGRALGIPMSDSYLQEDPAIKAYYQRVMQPTIKYGSDVERLSYKEAIVKYKPEVVVASWVTQLWRDHSDDGNGNMHGLDEEWILENVACYIHIGHANTHGRKRILKLPHEAVTFDWLFSRALSRDSCVIYIWDRK